MKIPILAIFLFLFIVSKRPFCTTTCPLGAIYSLFNRISLIGLYLDKNVCLGDKCNICREACPTNLNPYKDIDHIDCIRCLECMKACPRNAIGMQIMGMRKTKRV